MTGGPSSRDETLGLVAIVRRKGNSREGVLFENPPTGKSLTAERSRVERVRQPGDVESLLRQYGDIKY